MVPATASSNEGLVVEKGGYREPLSLVCASYDRAEG